MLYIQPSLDYKNAKEDNKIFLSNPSNLVNNFLVRTLDKFGVLEAPTELIKKIFDNPMASIPMRKEYSGIYARPIYGNGDYLFKIALEKLQQGEDVYSTPDAASLFLEWYANRNEDYSVSIDISTAHVPYSEIAKAYSDALTKPFHPNELEMLLKLFSLFYAKKMEEKKARSISQFQVKLEKLADKKREELDLDVSSIKRIVTEISSQNKEFGENNIFNKILEEIEKIEMLQYYGYEIDKFEEFAIFNFKQETKEFFEEELISFMESIENIDEGEVQEGIVDETIEEETGQEEEEHETEALETTETINEAEEREQLLKRSNELIPPQALKIIKRAWHILELNLEELILHYGLLSKKEDKKKFLRELEKRIVNQDSSPLEKRIQGIKNTPRKKRTIEDILFSENFRRMTADDGKKYFAIKDHDSYKSIEEDISGLYSCVLEKYFADRENPKNVEISYKSIKQDEYYIFKGIEVKTEKEVISIDGEILFKEIDSILTGFMSSKFERLSAYLNNIPFPNTERERNLMIATLMFGKKRDEKSFEYYLEAIREGIEDEIKKAIEKDHKTKRIKELLTKLGDWYYQDIKNKTDKKEAMLFDAYHILVVDSEEEKEETLKNFERAYENKKEEL